MSYLELLRSMLGKPDAEFREGQLEAIESIVDGKRTLVVQKTGWGKSIVYFLATRVLRDKGAGITMIVSPLISLMTDQIKHAEKMGLKVVTINSKNEEEHSDVFNKLKKGEAIDAILISPERLANEEFRKVLFDMTDNVGLFVVDEAHCISDWGHDFRPDYRRIIEVIDKIPSTVPVLAVTATANENVVEDIKKQIPGINVIRGSMLRESLSLQCINIENYDERIAWLGKNIDKFDGPGIIYCSTIQTCKAVNKYLKNIGKRSELYTGKLSAEERNYVIDRFTGDPRKIDVIVATIALGMGFDMPDLKYVIHFSKPKNIIAYYQQIGRAGREIPEAYAVLLYGREDDIVNKYFVENAFPEDELMEQIIAASIDHQDTGLNVAEYEKYVNAKRGDIKKCIKYLEVNGDIYSQNKMYYKSASPWHIDRERAEIITARRYEELRQMTEFSKIDSCYMKYIARVLGDDKSCNCGKCSNCLGRDIVDFEKVTEDEIAQARQLINDSSEELTPRKQWPLKDSLYELVGTRKIKIQDEYKIESGLCLSRYGNPGYGKMVRDEKFNDHYFSDELVDASVHLLRSFVHKNNIQWVTSPASNNYPELVKSFAERVADKLGLQYKDMFEKKNGKKNQREFHNSYYLFMNAYESQELISDGREMDHRNVLLIDDIADSQWTLTVCGYKLRKAESGLVYPFVLAYIDQNGDD